MCAVYRVRKEKTMKKLTVFYLKTCPYCRKAFDAVKELLAEEPHYGDADMEWIEESENPEIADRYDYYRVPSIFCGDEKLYECDPKDDYSEIRLQFEKALKLAAE